MKVHTDPAIHDDAIADANAWFNGVLSMNGTPLGPQLIPAFLMTLRIRSKAGLVHVSTPVRSS